MSLSYLDQQLDAIRARAEESRRNLAVTKDAIRKDASLSTIGRDDAIAAVSDQVKSTLLGLRAEEDKLAEDKRASLERTIAGTVGSDSASIINYRDAQDRADKIENRDEALRLMNRALTSGDRTLASAIAQAAIARGYRDVYKPYAEKNPTIAEAVEDLAKLNHYFDDISSVLAKTMAYSAS